MKTHALAAALLAPAAVLLATTGTTACGEDTCEKAADITKECTPPATGGTPTRTVETTKADCSGAREAESKCIVDNKDAFCAFLKDPAAASADNAYSKCVAALP